MEIVRISILYSPFSPMHTLIIGLDGATFDWVLPLAQRGLLPNLHKLIETGSWGRLASTVPPFTATAWSSFSTGQNPGAHGIISFQERDQFNYDVAGSGFVNAERFGLMLWDALSQQGQRSAVVNVPMSYPPRPLNGVMITGMLTPPDSGFTYPPELAKELDNYRIDVDFVREGEGFRQGGFPSKQEMMAQIRPIQAERTALCEKMLSDEAWDAFMVVYTGTDRVSHFFWDDLMALAENKPAPDEQIRDEVVAFLREMDEGIGKLLAHTDSETAIYVISDHGFGYAPTQRCFLNVWLEQNGWLKARESKQGFDLEALRVRIGRNPRLKKLIQAVVPTGAQMKAREVSESVSGELFDWSQTLAFTVPIYFQVCGIELNTVGNHREGVLVAGSEEYERVRSEIMEKASGFPAIERISRREDLFDGEHVNQFPDLIVELDPDFVPMTSLASSELTELGPPPFREGEHRWDGVFIAAGDGIRQQPDIKNLRLLDVTPTLLHGAGLAIPEQFDGIVLQEIFEGENQPVYQKFEVPDSGKSQSTSSDALADRLRGLGYIE